jgi:hypothetical protein
MPRVIRRPFKLAIKSSPSPASSRTPLNLHLPSGKNYIEALWTSVYVLGKNFKLSLSCESWMSKTISVFIAFFNFHNARSSSLEFRNL